LNLISCNKSTVRERKNQYEILICQAGEADGTDEVLKGFVEEDRRHRKMSCNKNTKENKKNAKDNSPRETIPYICGLGAKVCGIKMLPDIQPGNTKILYFFNCLLDGMHTIFLTTFPI